MITSTAPTVGREVKTASQWRLPVIVLVGLALRLAVGPFDSIEGLLDPANLYRWSYGNVARALVAGRGFGSALHSNQLSAMMPPVYSVIVAIMFKLFGVFTHGAIFAVHAFDSVLSALAVIPIFLMTRRSFGERVAWWAAWAWACSPYGIYFSAAMAWSTHLLLFCLCWLLYLAQDLERSPQLALWAGFGLLAGFAGLTEPSILVVVAFLLALAAWRLARAGKKWLFPGGVALLVLAATIAPWMIRNAVVFHRFIPMRDSMGLELWMGNNGYDVRFTSEDLNPLNDMKELADYDRMGETAYMDHKAQQAMTYIYAHPGWYVRMCVRRAVYLWTGYWSFDPEYLKLEPMDPFNVPYQSAFTLLGLIGLCLAWRRAPWEAVRFAGVLFLFPIIYYLSHPQPYHMRTLDPLVTILGCLAVVSWLQRKRAAMRAEPGIPVATAQ
jgi:4-amino-4-deoxy-L-arabinose transferase-like glycosyltransferase